MESTVGHPVMASGPGFGNGRQLGVGVHMTRAGAVLQLAEVVFQAVEGLLMSLGLEDTRMTAGAAGTIGGKLPGRLVRVGGVTGSARRRVAMLARILP